VSALVAPVVEPLYDHAAAEKARLVNQARARLLRAGGAVTFEMIAEATNRRSDAVRQWVSRRVRAGRMVTVSHEGATLVPSFQLTDAFEEDRAVGDIVERLVAAGMSGWAVWDWFVTPNTWLDADTPIETLRAGERGAVERAAAGMLQE
jgi:hypothetical protein